MVGVYRGQNYDLRTEAQGYVDQVLQGNPYLRQQSTMASTSVGGRRGYAAQLSGRSPVTGRNELTTIYTTQLRSGALFYTVTVVPSEEAYNYNNAFRGMLNSIRFID